MNPIYYVIAECNHTLTGIPIWRILHSFKCDLSDVERINREIDIGSLFMMRRSIQTTYYHREPENPFKEQSNEH